MDLSHEYSLLRRIYLTLMVLIFAVFLYWKKIAFRGYLFSRFAHYRIFFAGINFRGLLILCTFLNITQISKIKEKKKRKSF